MRLLFQIRSPLKVFLAIKKSDTHCPKGKQWSASFKIFNLEENEIFAYDLTTDNDTSWLSIRVN